ncbi:unnamed protein product [Mucor hiemalis]
MTTEDVLLNQDIIKKEVREYVVEEEEEDEEQQVEKKRIYWIPLESNPDVLNHIIRNNGVDPDWSFVDFLGFDEESLSEIPKQVSAIIFLFPETPKYLEFREKEESYLKIHEQNISPNIMHFKQTIGNACGMMALIHCLAHNSHLLQPGLFSRIVEETKGMSPSERAEYLETCEELAKVHDDAARFGQSSVPELGMDPGHHYIAFVEVDNHLYELDGSFPINHGKCTNFVQVSILYAVDYVFIKQIFRILLK